MNEKQAIKQFLYHPFKDITIPCRCGDKLKFVSLGADFTKGDACFECITCKTKMILGYNFVNEFPKFQDNIELIIVRKSTQAKS